MEVVWLRDKGFIVDMIGLDKEVFDDMEVIFGNGEDYDWVLQMEEEEEECECEEQQIEFKDVFELL